MKKVLLVLVILTVVATSVVGLVACGPADPNAFIAAILKADEVTIYSYDDGNETVLMSISKKGELCIPFLSIYLIKEGDKMALYQKEFYSDVWNKVLISTDSEIYKEYVKKIKNYKEEIPFDDIETYVEDDNGFWFSKSDVVKAVGVKIEDGKIVIYNKIDEEYVQSAAVSLKADIKLPEGAADAKVVNP